MKGNLLLVDPYEVAILPYLEHCLGEEVVGRLVRAVQLLVELNGVDVMEQRPEHSIRKAF